MFKHKPTHFWRTKFEIKLYGFIHQMKLSALLELVNTTVGLSTDTLGEVVSEVSTHAREQAIKLQIHTPWFKAKGYVYH